VSVGTLVRKTSNGFIGVIVKVSSSDDWPDLWCEVLYHNEQIEGSWKKFLEAI